MTKIKLYTQWIIAIFAVLIVTSPLWARSSPVGGGYLNLKNDGFAFVKKPNALQIENEFTIELWMYANVLPQSGEIWFIAGKLGSYQLILGNVNISFLSFKVYSPNGTWLITTPVDDDICARWMHIVGIYEDGTVRLAIDGVLLGSAEVPKNILQSNVPFSAGYAEGEEGISHFNGMIDELRVSSKVRYRNDFEPPSHPFKVDEDTLALWHFDEKEGAKSCQDSSGNGYTLIVENGFVEHPFFTNLSGKLHTTWGKLKEEYH